MRSITAREFERSIPKELQSARVIVLHGDNSQIKLDIFRAIRGGLSIATDDPFRLAQLDSSALDADPGSLSDELSAISMFGGSRLIRAIAPARHFGRLIEQALRAPEGDWILVIDTDHIDAPGPQAAQSGRDVIMVACGVESDGDFHSFIVSEFQRAGIELESGAIELLATLLGDQRSAARAELEKLSLLADSSRIVSIDDVKNVVADGSSLLADEVASSAFSGSVSTLVAGLDRLRSTSGDATTALGSASRLALSLYRSRINQWRPRPDDAAHHLNARDLRAIALSLRTAVLRARTDGANSTLLSERALVSLAKAIEVQKR